MFGFFAVTDFEWFDFLRRPVLEDLPSQRSLDEVNFWLPSARRFRSVPVGAPFFFKLKKPYYAIGGYGFFAGHSIVPARLAWDSFGRKNGAPDFGTLHRLVSAYRSEALDPLGNYPIGCVMIAEPVFFSDIDFIAQPADWPIHHQKGKPYDLTSGEGKRIWDACRARRPLVLSDSVRDPEDLWPGYADPQLVQPRIGQGIFRIAVTDAYNRACAVTNEHSLPVLEAAHIKPYAARGPHSVRNGIALRADVHRLFDQGYLTITRDYHVEVSGRLKAEFNNGRAYYPLHGTRMRQPDDPAHRPNPEWLDWHNTEVFRP